MTDERRDLYAASVQRLTAKLEDLRSERKRIVWVLPIGLVVALVSAFFRRDLAGLVALATATLFGVGQYIVLMHIQENTLALRNARRVLRGSPAARP